MFFSSIALIAVVLSVLVVLHELGHFLAAKMCGVNVEEFGLGYPPALLKLFKWRETTFTLNAIPFGGFVRLEGEDVLGEELEKITHSSRSLARQHPLKKLWIICAGAAMNYVIGIFAFAIIYMVVGIPQPVLSARIDSLAPNSPASQAGLPTSVDIIAVKLGNEVKATKNSQEVISLITENRGKTLTIVTTGHCDQSACQESAQEFSVYVRTLEETPAGEGSVGIGFKDTDFVWYPWYEMPFRAFYMGASQAFQLVVLTLQGLGDVVSKIVHGSVPEAVSGPVGIVYEAHKQQLVTQGWLVVLQFTGIISISLAVMNMLPIPALDGGRAVFTVVELLGGKHLLERWEAKAHQIGFLLLVGLLILVTIKDIARVF